ncbi:MAG: VapE domain-containing protein [Pseudomonadota bacterium]
MGSSSALTYPRQCVIVGSTNDQKYLFDQTGNRRFWPVRAGRFHLDKLHGDLDQLWAEAVVREAEGEPIVLSEHLWEAAAELADVRLIEDAFASVLGDWFSEKTGRVSTDSVKLLLGFEGGRLSPIEVQRIKTEMDRLGWEEKTIGCTIFCGEKRPSGEELRKERRTNARGSGLPSVPIMVRLR